MNGTAAQPGSLARNVLSSWLGIPVNLAYALIITPVVVTALEKEMYGVWSFLNGLLIYSDLLYFGLGSALIKYVAQYRAHDNQAAMNRLISVIVTVYGAIGVLCFVTLTVMSSRIPHAFSEPLSAESSRAAAFTCVLLGAQLVFVFLGSAFSGLISGHDRYDLVNVVYIAGTALRFIAIPIFVRAGHDPLVTLAWLTSAVTAAQAIAFAGIAYWYIPQLTIRPNLPRLDELRSLYGFGLQSFFIVFAVRLISYTDTTVIGITLGAASVALYTLPLQLVEYARTAVGSFSGVLLPKVTTLVARGEPEAVRRAYLDSARFACFLSGWLVATLIGVGPAFLSRWVGPEFGGPAQWVLVYLASAMFGQMLSTNGPFAFYQALHLVSFPAAILMTEAFLNLGLSIWLAPRIGITGVALATAASTLFVSTVLLPPYLCRRLEIRLRTFVKQSVLPGIWVLVATLGTEWTASVFIPGGSYAGILARAAVTLPVVLILFRATFPPDQRRAVLRLIRLKRG